MQFVKQRLSIPVRNVDDSIRGEKKNKKIIHHSPLLPNTIRSIICGRSNCGKTNALISLIENPNGLRFQNVYIYSRTLDQDKYKYLERLLTSIKGVGFYKFSSCEQVIQPEKAKRNSIFIFDDVVCDKQDAIKAYFCMGRHRAIDCFYLTQTYTRLPKHLIRDNANFIILFKQDELNLRHVYDDYSIACDMTFNQFREMCNRCWREKYGFVVIDLESEPNEGRYRKNFDNFIRIYKDKTD